VFVNDPAAALPIDFTPSQLDQFTRPDASESKHKKNPPKKCIRVAEQGPEFIAWQNPLTALRVEFFNFRQQVDGQQLIANGPIPASLNADDRVVHGRGLVARSH
jgi:hypothetical protein